MTLAILSANAQIAGLVLIGWLARKSGHLGKDESEKASGFSIDYLMPLLVFSSLMTGLDRGRMAGLWPLPLVGLGIVAAGVGVGLLLRYALGSQDADIRKTFVFFCGVNNYGYLPIIIIGNIGDAGMLANLFLLNFGSTLGAWTIGVAVLGARGMRNTLRNIFSPTLVALVLAVILKSLDIGVPTLVLSIAGTAGAVATPLIIMMIGAYLYDIRMRGGWRDLAYSTIVRCLVLPLLYAMCVRPLGLARDIYLLGLIVASMPVGIAAPFLVLRYGGDPRFAARATLVTTLGAIVTVPFIIALFGQ